MKLIIAAMCVALTATNASADLDVTPNHEKSTSPVGARYEIVQSQLAARWTYKVDRVCGYVYQMVKATDDSLRWSDMPVFNLPKCENNGRARYQLFVSGLATRHSYLINTDTGATWVLVKIKPNEDESGWERIGG